jgi:hypothetical protein
VELKMPEPQDNRASGAVNPPVITLESVADISRATVQICVNRGLGAVELHVDRKPLLLLSQSATLALIAALLEALDVIAVSSCAGSLARSMWSAPRRVLR